MEIKLVEEDTFSSALEVYIASWRESHRDVCSPEFLENRDYVGYLRKKLGKLWMISDGTEVGIFTLDGENFGDLYIHPSHQGRGYGKAAIHFAKQRTAVLRLTVLSINSAAIALYEKMSFCFTDNDTPLRDGLWEREMVYTER